ncbi:hypothetical protein CBOM_01186 [Ceraceosorus bombacis]|uniref:Uncharacterized protein n=1 Tax=Ceraceosorus bombacis TaxID=401625 RepID=A0A0P1BBA2_9BASI|nr:hypothetical protein CBOM_01186 [Ceraceosorus bombacis]
MTGAKLLFSGLSISHASSSSASPNHVCKSILKFANLGGGASGGKYCGTYGNPKAAPVRRGSVHFHDRSRGMD